MEVIIVAIRVEVLLLKVLIIIKFHYLDIPELKNDAITMGTNAFYYTHELIAGGIFSFLLLHS